MTIAACYVSSEGVVLGADSTSTLWVPDRNGVAGSGASHHYDSAQKVFEVGDNSTIGVTLWGLGSIGQFSHRVILAEVADQFSKLPPGSIAEVATKISEALWARYSAEFAVPIQRLKDLQNKAARTPEEDAEVWQIHGYGGGYCVGGYTLPNRQPKAFQILYDPSLTAPPVTTELAVCEPHLWGWSNIIDRVLYGFDSGTVDAILRSGKWTGTDQDLYDIIRPRVLGRPWDLPLREAIDWVHSSIYTTIKAIKFSHYPTVCGGPIEIALISNDRPFRWVRHKSLDQAIG